MKKQLIYFLLTTAFTLGSCKYYNFTGGNVGEAKSYTVTFIRNEAPIFQPGLDRDFTTALQDRIQDQTNLTLQNSNSDLLYEGEITEYRISPLSAIADQNRGAAQNRLTMSVNIRFFNKTKPDADFEKRFSFFSDFEAATSIASVRQQLHDEIFERITQDIFQESLADW